MPRIRRRQALLASGLVFLVGLACWNFRPFTGASPISRSSDGPGIVNPTEANWPQLRGPTYDAVSLETGLADSWPEIGPPVVWTRELGQGYSSFSAVGDRVYTQSQSLYQQFVVCLNAKTGETIWTHNYGWPFEESGLYPGPRGTPTWHDGRIYFSAPNGMIGCLNAEDGVPLWSRNPKKEHRGRGTDFGYACSPVIVQGRVIVPVGGIDNASVVALDARDGATVWTAGEASASYATPLPIQLRGRSLAIIPLENSIAAFDLVAGKQIWEIEFSTGYDEHSAEPIYREPLLVVASPFQAGAKCYRLADDDEVTSSAKRKPSGEFVPDQAKSGTPSVVWEVPKFSNDVASSVLVDGRIYGFDLKDPQSRLDRPSRGEFRCLDFETGRIIWSTKKVGQASMIVADQKLILFADNGELILARLGTDEYTELARTQVFRDEVCWTSPAFHRGCIYLRTQTRAACLYLGKAPYESKQPVRSVKDIPRGRAFDAKWLIGGEREFPAAVPDWNEFRHWYQWSLGGLALASIVALLSLLGSRGSRWVPRSSFTDRRAALQVPPDLEQNNQSPSQSESSLRTSTDRMHVDQGSVRIARTLFWLTAMITGIVGSPLINARQNEYVLLWPLVLWSSFQLTINVITVTERHSNRRRLRWLSRGCGLLFIGTCVVYFSLCRSLGYAIEWAFLVGFLPAFVVAALAARFLTTRARFWPIIDFAFSVLSFTAYFWFSVIFIKWKLTVGS